MFSNKASDTVHKPQPQGNTTQPTITPSVQHQNVPRQRANPHQAQEVEFHTHTKALPTHLFTSELHNKSTSHNPNTWHRPQTNPTPVLAAPHNTPVNRQTFQNHNVRGSAGQNRTPYNIRNNRYTRQENMQPSYPHTQQHPYIPNNNDSHTGTPQYRHYSRNNTHSHSSTSLRRPYLPNNTDSYLQTAHYRSYLPNNTNSREESYVRMHQNIEDNGHQKIKRRIGCYNCGEFNHKQSTCRFDYKLRCELCHALGHKMRLCQYYST